MPNISKIEGITPKAGSYENDTSDFLKEEEINTTAEKLKHGTDLDAIYEDIKGQIENGLSVEALLIEGRAPLYELTTELLNHLTATKEDYNLVGEKQIIPLGNKHRQDEATTYFEKVKDEYKKCLINLKEAIDAYNSSNTQYVKGYDEEDQNPVYGNYGKINISIDTNTLARPPIIHIIPTASDDKNPTGHEAFMNKIETAAKEAQDYFENPLTLAKKLSEECSNLETTVEEIDADSYDTSASTGEDGKADSTEKEGKQDFIIDNDHKKLGDKKGKTYDDGSTVVVEKGEDGSKIYYRYNANGDLTEVHVVTKDGEDEYYTRNGERGTKVQGGNNPAGNPVVPRENAKAKGYDDNTAVVTVINEDGNKEYHRYNPDGDLVEIEDEKGKHYAVVDGERYEYDLEDDVHSEKKTTITGNSGSTSTTTTVKESGVYDIKDEDGNVIAIYDHNTATYR